MRWLFLCVILLFFPVACRSQVLLNEVYYDHPGTDEGYEFIEIVNLTDGPLALAGYAVEFHDGASGDWVTIWRAVSFDTIAGPGLFVLGGESVAPAPDAVDELGLQNGPDAVRLVSDGRVVDLLGYGSLDDPRYFEGTPAPDVASGVSLARRPDGVDTDDNGADFVPRAPSPGRFNVARHDVALRAAPGTRVRDARAETGVEVLSLRVFNLGVEPAEPGTVRVDLADSTDLGAFVPLSVTVPHAVPAGDSADVQFAVELSEGTHRIRASAVCPRDERPENDTVWLLRRVGASLLLVSEVMSYPLERCPEYVELFNGGTAPYELMGHWIRDAAHGPELIVSVSRVITPGKFVVLTGDAAGLLVWFPGLSPEVVVEIEGPWPSLNQTGSGGEADSVIVLDADLLPVERVAYPPQPAATEGRSLERVDLFAGPGPHTWVLSDAVHGGSPGERSRSSRLAPHEGRSVAVSPNPFDPYRSEDLVVTVPRHDDRERVVVGVFDIDGCRVADLGSTTTLPSTFVWDGRDASGSIVLPGLYVLACEFFGVTSGSRRVEKVVVGCGRRDNPGASR